MSNVGSTNPYINVGGTQSTGDVNQTPPQGGLQGPRTDTSPPPVGSTSPGGGAPVLAPPDEKLVQQQQLNLLINKLGAGDGDVSIIMEKLQKVQKDVGDRQVDTQKTGIDIAKTKIDKNTSAQIQKIEEGFQKMLDEKAAETAKKVFMVVGAIFGLLGAIFGAIATGGVGLPAAIAIGVAAVGVITTVLQVSGGMDAIFDAMNLSPEARLGIQIGIAALLLIGSVASIGTSIAGVGAVAAKVAQTTSQVVKLGSQAVMTTQQAVGAMAGTTFGLVAKGIGIAGQAGSGLMKIGEGISAGVRTGAQYEVALIDDSRKSLERDNKRIKQQQEELMEAIRDLMKQLDEGVSITTQVIQGQHDLNSRLIRTNI